MKIEVTGLDAGYGGIRVLRGISFSVASGEVLGVLGRNGMGKSTLIRAIAGTIPVTRGAITFDGADATHLPVHMRARRGLTTIVQGRGMFPRMTVRESLEMGRIASGSAKRDRMDEVLSYFPKLAERLKQRCGTLSGGEQQMLAIARTLMGNPGLLLLDEPSEGLAPAIVDLLARAVAELRREGLSVLLAEQNVRFAERVATRAYRMETGGLRPIGQEEQSEHAS
jgi:ABC-type branched-subunit amino acid transport system ATPase component